MPDAGTFNISHSGDLALLLKNEFDGNLKTNEGGQIVNTTGDLGTLTASSGKDMYLVRAHGSLTLNGTSNNQGLATIVLKVNGVVKDTWNASLTITSGEGATSTADYEFLVGFKVIATQVIKLECTVSGTNIVSEGNIQCIEVNTGEDPTVV